MQILKTMLESWKKLLWLLLVLLRKLLGCCRRLPFWPETGKRSYEEACCTKLPPDVKAMPDPYIYSQEWLKSRGIAYVWDNPDFRIIETATGTVTPRYDLKSNTQYDVEITVHNGSFMAALGTSVRLEARKFGMGTPVDEVLGSAVVNVPGAGSNTLSIPWTTPAEGGHRCLRAYIYHHDDANPLNNVGQHNTDIARPASPTRKIYFAVANDTEDKRTFNLRMDSYRLPEAAACVLDFIKQKDYARTHKEKSTRRSEFDVRNSLEYLRYLQAKHDVSKFPVPEYLNAKLDKDVIELEPGEAFETSLEMTPPPKGKGMQSVNVNAFDGDRLVGGITAYVFEAEGE